MAVARDDLGRAARKRGIEGQVTTIPHFGIRCILVRRKRFRKCDCLDENQLDIQLRGSVVTCKIHLHVLQTRKLRTIERKTFKIQSP